MDTDTDGKFGRYLAATGRVGEASLLKAQAFQQYNSVMRIGEILVSMQALSFADLIEALQHYRAQCKLGQLLVWDGLITKLQLTEALERQRATGRLLGEILIEMGACSELQVKDALAMQKKGQEVTT